jgi:hypothetical protein
MATNIDVSDFITELENHFIAVKHESDARKKSWLATFGRELSRFSVQVLVEAARDLILTRKERYFPPLSECVTACQNAKKRFDLVAKAAAAPAQSNWKPEKDDEWADWRRDLADKLIIGPMGKQAAASNWILQLHDFIRKNQRLPNAGMEVNRLKEEAKIFDEKYAECVAFRGWKTTTQSEPGAMAQAGWLVKLGNQMLARRAELADRVANGVIGR